MIVNRIYNGWVLDIEGIEYTVCGSNKIRSTQWYILANDNDTRAIRRSEMLAGFESGAIKYVTSVAA